MKMRMTEHGLHLSREVLSLMSLVVMLLTSQSRAVFPVPPVPKVLLREVSSEVGHVAQPMMPMAPMSFTQISAVTNVIPATVAPLVVNVPHTHHSR